MDKYRAADKLLPSRTDKGQERSLSKINSIIIHTTGYGAGLKRINDASAGDLGAVGSAYAKRMAGVLKYKGHFLIDHVGIIYHFIPLDEVAWHTGSSKRKKLKASKPHGWWVLRWKDLKVPTQLPSWKENSPNRVSVGIDLLAHGTGAIVEGYTDAQYKSLAKLINALCTDFSIPRKRECIVGHEDVDPISRGNRSRGWDPGKFDYNKLLSLVQAEDGPEADEDAAARQEFPTPTVVPTRAPPRTSPSVSILSMVKSLFRMLWRK